MYKLALFLAACLSTPFMVAAQSGPALTSYVNPFLGTAAADAKSLAGNTFPGATVPFGFVQLSPDVPVEIRPPVPGGYNYNSKTIVGFSHTHMSGVGIADYFDILLLPATGEVRTVAGQVDKPGSGYGSSFSHDQESARPGYYQVVLKDYNINAELTATEHVGFHKYTFPAGQTSGHVIIDVAHSPNKKRGYYTTKVLTSQIKVIDNKTIEGYRFMTGWVPVRKVYFRIEFSKPFSQHALYDNNRPYDNLKVANGSNWVGAFHFSGQTEVMAKVSLSAVSVENARENMKAELPGWDFRATVKSADDKWERELQTIRIKGTEEQKKIFYTSLYHTYIQPNNIADVNGDYTAIDLTAKNAGGKHFSTFSLWDTYRATHPLYTITQPKLSADFINSMLRQYEVYGYLPIWQMWGGENYAMIGNHAIPVIVDAALKGIIGFDINKAYEAVKESSLIEHYQSPFGLWEKYGYMPYDAQGGSVSVTLEIAYDDWCVAQLAKKLGKEEDYRRFAARSAFYKNLYDRESGFMRARNKEGKWLSPFNPLIYDKPYVEGNAWQYLWYVPQDVPGLMGLMGGAKKFAAKLDTLFTLNYASNDDHNNASGFIGQYAHGNEVSHHVAYLYNYAGQPWKSQQYVARIVKEQYNSSPSGLSGNDDCGQMSAWYVFSAMGFYPVNPANGVYVIGSPALEEARFKVQDGKEFTVRAKGASPQNIYIQSATLNGKPYNKTFITDGDLKGGGTLEFVMGSKPNYKWGTEKSSVPPLSAFQ